MWYIGDNSDVLTSPPGRLMPRDGGGGGGVAQRPLLPKKTGLAQRMGA
jgi:hypothetical protein